MGRSKEAADRHVPTVLPQRPRLHSEPLRTKQSDGRTGARRGKSAVKGKKKKKIAKEKILGDNLTKKNKQVDPQPF